LGSASVVYEKVEDSKRAIAEYHGAYLDDKLLTVEFDKQNVVRVPKITLKESAGGRKAGKTGKTLRLGGGVRGRR